MLDHAQRQDRYIAQNGSLRLTPAQRRRVAKKDRAQSPEAAVARVARSSDRAEFRAARKARLDGAISTR